MRGQLIQIPLLLEDVVLIACPRISGIRGARAIKPVHGT
jgi:hypothetical protein